jgi:predicted transposase YdaD
MYMVLLANALKTREVLKMSDIATIDEVFEGLGIIEYYEARGEVRGEARGKEEKAVEIARNLKKIGLSLERIVEATGLTERQINGF